MVTTFSGRGRLGLRREMQFKMRKGDVSHTVSLFFRANYVEQPATKPKSDFKYKPNPQNQRTYLMIHPGFEKCS